MREIKFRAWDNINKCFHYATMDDLLDGTRPLDIRVAAQEGRLGEMEQFTGLRDKNGREIYEGDICIHPNGHVAPVAWSNDLLAWNFSINEYVCDQEAGGVGDGEVGVVGNIHENPELLV